MVLEVRPVNYSSRELDSLQDYFAYRIKLLIQACQRQKLCIVPFSTRRGPLVQGRMWCQSRTEAEVSSQRKLLEGAGAPWLASFLRDEWASTGRWATDRLPGQSWHQLGEACDFFIAVGGKAVWIDSRFTDILGKAAKDLGLVSGAAWPRGRDPHHIQLRKESTPGLVDGGTPWEDIDHRMRKLYGPEPINQI